MILHTTLISLGNAGAWNLSDSDAPCTRNCWSTSDYRYDDRVALAKSSVNVHYNIFGFFTLTKKYMCEKFLL